MRTQAWSALILYYKNMPKEFQKIIITVAKQTTSDKDALDALRCAETVKSALLNKGAVVEIIYLEKNDFLKGGDCLEERINQHMPCCVFNLFEGFSGGDAEREAEFIKILERKSIPYTGNCAKVLARCLNKQKVKDILIKNEVPVPKGVFVKNKNDLSGVNSLNFPVFVKPCFEDASLGIDSDSFVTGIEKLFLSVAKKLKRFSQGLIVEEFIPGNEYNIGFLGDFPYEVLGVSVMDYSGYPNLSNFLTYQSKWEQESLEYKSFLPSPKEKIEKFLKEHILKIASLSGKLLGCRSYFRVDLRVNQGIPYILDVNPNPDINIDSGLIRQAYNRGYSYSQIIGKILSFAL